MKSLGIDIGSSSIKIVEVQATSKGFQITQFTEHPLSVLPGADQELEILEFLRDFLGRYDHSQTRFILGLRQDRVAIRNKFFPFNDRNKIFKSLAFELEEDIPFSSENAIFDAKIIRTIGSGAEVLACAAPKVHVQKCLQQAQDSGIEPHVISSEGTAFANVIEDWNAIPPAITAPTLTLDGEEVKPPRHLHLLLNMGHTRTLVCAFEGNSLIAVRSILWGGKNIAEAISQKYEIPFLESLKELQTKAFILTSKQGATFDQVTFSDTIAKSVREMSRDLQLSILELKSEFNATIESIGLSGGVSQIRNLGPFLTQVLEVPVNFKSLLERTPNVLFDRSPPTDAKCGIALGLAFEGFKKPRNPAINFMRGEFAKENHHWKNFWNKWSHAVQVGAAAVLILFVYSYLRDHFSLSLTERAQDVLTDQAKSVAGLRGRSASESGIRKYIRENKKRAQDLKLLANVAGMNSALDVLKKVSDATPPKSAVTLEVHVLQVEDSLVSMEGYVNNPQEVKTLQQSLTGLAADGKIQTGKTSLGSLPGKTAFALSFTVDRGIQKVTR